LKIKYCNAFAKNTMAQKTMASFRQRMRF
jgi:hypothetical protein